MWRSKPEKVRPEWINYTKKYCISVLAENARHGSFFLPRGAKSDSEYLRVLMLYSSRVFSHMEPTYGGLSQTCADSRWCVS